jgi:hypothetical protein
LQAEQRLENSLDDIDDFAKGGLAKLLGEWWVLILEIY